MTHTWAHYVACGWLHSIVYIEAKHPHHAQPSPLSFIPTGDALAHSKKVTLCSLALRSSTSFARGPEMSFMRAERGRFGLPSLHEGHDIYLMGARRVEGHA